MVDASAPEAADIAGRQAMMRLCARSLAAELSHALEALAPVAAAKDLRAPAAGLVMLRGRMGGDGAPFNLGEATVARATVALADGTVGFAFHLGRDLAKARSAAILDALWQGAARPRVEAALRPSGARLAAEHQRDAARTAATRVDFFTLVRGED